MFVMISEQVSANHDTHFFSKSAVILAILAFICGPPDNFRREMGDLAGSVSPPRDSSLRLSEGCATAARFRQGILLIFVKTIDSKSSSAAKHQHPVFNTAVNSLKSRQARMTSPVEAQAAKLQSQITIVNDLG